MVPVGAVTTIMRLPGMPLCGVPPLGVSRLAGVSRIVDDCHSALSMRTMSAAVECAIRLDPVADDPAVTMATDWREFLDGALEAVERVRLARGDHLEGLVIVIPANFASRHLNLLAVAFRGVFSCSAQMPCR
jgi:hypothetical protein